MEKTEQGRPVRRRVAENVRLLRRERGWSLEALSARLARLGRPLSLSGISKVENGDRGVDVDELVALALALDVTPNRLLLTAEAGAAQIELTPQACVEQLAAWRWACGDEEPLGHLASDDDVVHSATRTERFVRENRPHDPDDTTTVKELFEHEEVLLPVAEAWLEARSAGLSSKAIAGYVSMADSFAVVRARLQERAGSGLPKNLTPVHGDVARRQEEGDDHGAR